MHLLSLLAVCALISPALGAIEQVHIAYTRTPAQLSVDFVSTDNSTHTYAYTSLVCDHKNHHWRRTQASSFHMEQVGTLSQALLDFTGVQQGESACYMVGSEYSNSSVFEVVPVVNRPEVFAVFGDFGLGSTACLNDLIEGGEKGVYDSILHVGDFAYDLETNDSVVGNAFMRDIQAYAATHPLMPVEGNHENCPACSAVPNMPITENNFTQYQARFWSVALFAGQQSGTGSNRYYSFNQGLTHFLVFSAEAYAYESGQAFIKNMLDFMRADLAGVDRSVTPWVVGLVHKTWWMQPDAYADFNPILENGGVDILFCGHAHNYNRYMPYSNLTGAVDTASVSADGSVYTNPKYPVTIITGSPGDQEGQTEYTKDYPSYTGTMNYGYGYFIAHNATHATWAFKTVKPYGESHDYSDSLLIIQEHHRAAVF